LLDKTEKMDSSLPVSDESIKALEAQGFNTDMVQRLSSKMVEMDRANRSAGRQRTISSAQLGTLNMLQAGPYGRLRQCLAEIENRRVAVESTYWNYREQELEVEELLEKGDAKSLLEAEKITHHKQRHLLYVEGALKEIAVFQEAYEEIRESHGIREDWDEVDFEKAEIQAKLRLAFKQCHRDVVSQGFIGSGNMEFIEQYGVHPSSATKVVREYVGFCEEQMAEGVIPTIANLNHWLDNVCELFKDGWLDQIEDIGIKEENFYREEIAFKSLRSADGEDGS